jgi:hypothetical protein
VFADPKKACKALDDVLSGSPNDNFRVKGGTPVLSSGSIPWQVRLFCIDCFTMKEQWSL